MRIRRASSGLSVHLIAGSHVVLLGFDMDRSDCEGLMGFAIHRTDHTEGRASWMKGIKTFQATDPGHSPGSRYSTLSHPIQGFTWSDFTAKPDHKYTYKVVALTGTPQDLGRAATVSVTATTESPADGDHDIYFNRGVAASQEYARRFHNVSPTDAGPEAFKWLSRGLFEAMTEFIERAGGRDDELRVCAYEFHFPPVLHALRAAAKRGAAVRVIYDCRRSPPSQQNVTAADEAGIQSFCIQRKANRSAISHNKFIVLLKRGRPTAVLTGGTNFSEGGIYGHSNVVHIVEEPRIAEAYLRYWELLSQDPKSTVLRPQLSAMYRPNGRPPRGTGVVFSPRESLDALEWYASLAKGAQRGLFVTFAFGMHPLFQDVYRTGSARMRFALMEQPTRPMPAGPTRDTEVAKITKLRRKPENRFAIGSHLESNGFDRWLRERLSGLNRHVRYVHTKYMLIDPLGSDPLVIAGSANFSAASTNENDENMLVIRGNRRVADVYLGEFMRLYNHYAFREWASAQPRNAPRTPSHLRTDRWWKEYFGNTPRSRQREYFAG